MAARDDRRWRASAAALALVIVALNVDLRTGPTGPVGSVRSLARSAVFPMQRGFAAIPAPLSLIFGNKRLQRENDELREQVEELKGNEVRTDELERQVRELTALSDLTFAPDLPGVTAEIVVLSASNFEQTVQSLGLGREDVVQLARNSFEASFISAERRAACMASPMRACGCMSERPTPSRWPKRN